MRGALRERELHDDGRLGRARAEECAEVDDGYIAPCRRKRTGDVGGGGNEPGVTVACESNALAPTVSTGDTRRLLRRRRSAGVWYSCGDAVAAGAHLEKDMPNAAPGVPLPEPVVDPEIDVASASAAPCSTAAVTPARAAENAIPPRAFIPLKTVPLSLTASFPRSACERPGPNLDWESGAGAGTLVTVRA